MSKILIIDDDFFICKTLMKIFKKMGHETDHSLTLKEGLDTLFSDEFDIVFLDVNLPDGNGLDAIEDMKEHPFSPEIIIITGESDPEGAELAMKSRAWDYILKSGSQKEFKFSLIRALEYREQKKTRTEEKKLKRESIIGQSRQIKSCLEKVSKASNNDIPTLITGETGTGKELLAKAIHENSLRKENSFIVVDCAALPENLVESVLFGHLKGAFTGADADKAGLIKLADKGTLFLDEVGELHLSIQKKFLRALQEKRFRPIGSKEEISSDFRLVTATHRDVSKMVKQKLFREDFYFRIASIKIEIPPLRKRKSDIPFLVNYHLNRKYKVFNKLSHVVSEEFLVELEKYDWPGNVRELFNTIDYTCSDAFQESILFSKHLPENIRIFNIQKKIKANAPSKTKPDFNDRRTIPVAEFTFKAYIEAMKQKYVKDLMSHAKWDIKTACRLSDLSRGHLYSLFKKYGISDH